MAEYTGIDLIDQMLESSEIREDEFGNEIRDAFYSTERYLFDVHMEKTWEQFDTDQDASYFGAWTNRVRFCTLTYAEGDICFVQCADAEAFDQKLASMCKFYGPTPFMVAIGNDGRVTNTYQDRSVLFIDPAKCPPSPIKFSENDEDTEPDTES